MTSEDKFRQERFARIRRVKRLLRPLPRRANIHRYPFLKWFAASARKRSYLWSFRKEHVIPAIYAGTILSLLPLYGIQMVLAFFTSLAFRANLVVVVALQFITNPFTLVPVYAFTYKIGDLVLAFFATTHIPADDLGRLTEETGQITTTSALYSGMMFFIKLSVGGVILGFIVAFILSFIYRMTLKAGHQYKIHHSRQPSATEMKSASPKDQKRMYD